MNDTVHACLVPVLESPVEGEEPMDEVSGDPKAFYDSLNCNNSFPSPEVETYWESPQWPQGVDSIDEDLKGLTPQLCFLLELE